MHRALHAALYRLLGDDAYALLRVPGYARRVLRATNDLRAGRNTEYEPRELRFLHARLPTLRRFVDVGAYLGDYCIPVARAKPEAQVIAFEALPSTAKALRLLCRFLAPGVELHAVAAGDARGELDLSVELVGGAPTPTSASQHLPPGAARRTFRVPVRTVDEILDGRAADLIKLDVEGAEEAALFGMEHALAHRPALLVELWHEDGPHRARRDRVVGWLAARGYEARLLDEAGRTFRASPEALRTAERAHTLYCNYVFLPRT